MEMCHFGLEAIGKTSWTNENPGRQFYTCPLENNVCQYFNWLDPPMCQRSNMIIPGLLRSKNRLEQEINVKLMLANVSRETKCRV
ncbi:hypothetical protein M8C21_030121 [Ambrosia artemisiifolia]|uniref:GRF-type domain-containing protein n=1 Tax=Ambrosia artemisiifolia TaxID=4212 RepID=A0AAD5GRP9_AMBAR|nr:hypothetical protein M8C21_030121 [Ambrosia artemisiifolia]